jgi:glycosyltransferase involved in cell wall biosynthesis
MDKNIKVLHVVSGMNRGGVETYLMNILRSYNRELFEMDICYTGQTPGDYADEIRQLGNKLIPCRMHYDLVRFIPRFIHLLRKGKYDIIDGHDGDFAGPQVMSARWAGVAGRVASYHNVEGHCRRGGIRDVYVKGIRFMVDRYSNAITGCSKAALDAHHPGWDQNDKKVFEVCYYGIDYEKFATGGARGEIRSELGISEDCPVVGHVGRFYPPKNHFSLVDTAKLVIEKKPNTKFLLVGDGPLRPQIEEYVNSKGLAENFIFTGKRADIPRVLSAMDVFFFPSVDEGFGLVLLEAQAAGVAIVASSIAGVKEAIPQEYLDFLADPKDVETFSKLLLNLLNNPAKREVLTKKGRGFAKKFTMAISVEQFQNIYKKLLKPC